MLGRLLGGKYQITRLLGEGGMGAVYEAQHTAIGRRVAVKTIRHGRLEQPAMLDRFRREAFAMAAVESDHVATILDAGDDPESGTAYLAMELLSGNDLARVLLRVGPLHAQTALRIVHQALEGLRAAHQAGIAHRDIKPSNIFVARRPDESITVKLVDFGIARSLTDSEAPASKKVTESGVVLGSPPYMSPEQFAASPALDFRTDLWSLGVVLFEMLAGENPYARAADLPHMLSMICLAPPPSVREAAPWVPDDVAAIVARAMRQKPAKRYGSAADMLADVAELIRGSPELTQAMFARISETEKARLPEMVSAVGLALDAGAQPNATAVPATVSAPPSVGGGTTPMPRIGPHGTVPVRASAADNAPADTPGRTSPMPASAVMRAVEASALPVPRREGAPRDPKSSIVLWGIAGERGERFPQSDLEPWDDSDRKRLRSGKHPREIGDSEADR